jgi:dihydrofolate reductase
VGRPAPGQAPPPIRCSVFIATSLDGFISRPDGSIDWLEEANGLIPAGEDCGYAAFIATVDALVMGRNTFDQVLGFGKWPYGDTPVTVLSDSLRALPAHLPRSVSVSAGAPAALLVRLAAAGRRHVYVDGGVTIQRFLGDGLIDEMTITVVPVLLGAGRPLFGPLPADVRLELLSSRMFPFGFVQSRYRVARSG